MLLLDLLTVSSHTRRLGAEFGGGMGQKIPTLNLRPLFHKNPSSHLFSPFVLSRASRNTTSSNIAGDGCMGRPPPQILGDRSPVPPKPTPMCLQIKKVFVER